MKTKKMDIVRGSGNLFKDLGHHSADVMQIKAILAAEIIKALDLDFISVREAQERTGIEGIVFTRIRKANLGRFTIDKIISIINRLGSRVTMEFDFHRDDSLSHCIHV